jgi:PAS domain S-box-containing protein
LDGFMLLLFDGDLAPQDTFRFLEEKIGVGLWSLELATDQMKWSSGLFKILGVEPGSTEPSFAKIRSQIHPNDRLSRQDIDAMLAKGTPIDRQFRIIRPDGRIRWVSNRGEMLFDSNGVARRAIGIIYDITEMQNAVLDLRASERRYRALAEATSTVIWTAPADGQVADIVEWRRLTGQSPSETQGSGWLDAIHPDDRDRVHELRSRSLAEKSVYRASYRLRMQDGRYDRFLSQAVPVLDDKGTLVEWVGALVPTEKSNGSKSDPAPQQLNGALVRAARGLLNWSIQDLADASSVSVSTVRRIEEHDGVPSVRSDMIDAIGHALRKNGVEFVGLPDSGPAVRLKPA